MTADTGGAVERPAGWRRQAREAALQMLYQAEVGRTPIDEVCRTFWTTGPAAAAAAANVQHLASSLARGVAARTAAIDPLIGEAAQHWRLERMHVMDRLILRLAVYEFLHEAETPGKVVINEALELARTFSAGESVRFVNGVLDAVRRTLSRE